MSLRDAAISRRAPERRSNVRLARPTVCAALVLVVGVLAFAAAGCGSAARRTGGQSGAVSSAPGGGSAAAAGGRGSGAAHGTGAEVRTLLAGIPQRGDALGDPNAPVTLEYFADLQCPFCRRFTLGKLTALIERYVRPGELRIEFRSMQSATHDRQIFIAQQVAALAAGAQDRLWNYVELFYREQGEEDSGYVTESYLQGLAQQVGGLNLGAWTAARGDPRFGERLARDARTVREAGLTITPSFLIAHERGAHDVAAIKQLVQS